MSNTKTSNIEPSDELLECFDDEGLWHGIASVWLFNSKGEILCSKRSDVLSGNPGKWQTCFGGHVKANNI